MHPQRRHRGPEPCIGHALGGDDLAEAMGPAHHMQNKASRPRILRQALGQGLVQLDPGEAHALQPQPAIIDGKIIDAHRMPGGFDAADGATQQREVMHRRGFGEFEQQASRWQAASFQRLADPTAQILPLQLLQRDIDRDADILRGA